ncbi:MAG: NAD(P)-dependent glycerol-3-phosphate dehydrogenase [Planctomycetes bacterium]|nr:NAD(P)-dependent glycerol-3-phosphate dehydrogenase [Planctomycetota bacterium]
MSLTAVVGTGSWGTAVAAALARDGRPMLLWGRDAAKVAELATTRRHPQLAEHQLPTELAVTADPTALSAADLVLWAVPTQHTAAMAVRLAGALRPGTPVVSLAKGLEQGSLRRVSEVLGSALGSRPYGALSGPSHASEVLNGRPACLVVAGPDQLVALSVTRVHGRSFRCYTTTDLLGVEIAGALKNVIAIAAGICDGLRLGDNVKAAVITRGVAEMRRLGRAMGAQDATFAGMAGVGDLLTTCYSPLGRNRALGLAIGGGADPQQHLAGRATVAEGAWTARAATELGRRHGVELPITSQVASVIWAAKPVAQAMDELLSRAPKEEDA